MKITKKMVKAYFIKFGGDKTNFTNMLLVKLNFAITEKRKVYAFDGMKDAKQLQVIFDIADNLL